jgi:predicted hydrocarbon binding protein
MNIPVNKNRAWMARLHESIDQLDQNLQQSIMKPAGEACASDLMSLCEKYLGKKVISVADLVTGWNILREKRNLKGTWEFEGNGIRGIFGECGCPLVCSGLIELHPVQCLCSQGLMETIFSRVAEKPVDVEIRRSIGRGDDVCDFFIRL